MWRAEALDGLHEAVAAAVLWETGASAVPHHWHTEALQVKTQLRTVTTRTPVSSQRRECRLRTFR